jgi:predicted heme/steroid binding protein
MMKKIHSLLLLLMAAGFILSGCGPQGGAAASSSPSGAGSTELVLTLDELSKYNGQNGSPAYIAIDGVIYDVTSVPQWKDGKHNGFTAGSDLTDAIKNVSPHGISKLKSVPIVGKLAG